MRHLLVLLIFLVSGPLGLKAQEVLTDSASLIQLSHSSSIVPDLLLAATEIQVRNDTSVHAPELPPADFVEVDQEPVVLAKKNPAYPDIALKEHREGSVWVKIWIDKTGTPRDVVVMKSTDTIFNRAATDAAWQFRFTPAYVKKAPVDVWVAVPFKFAIAEKSDKETSDTARKETSSAVQRFSEGVRAVIDGASLDILKKYVDPSAYLINGGSFESLYEAAQRRDKARLFLSVKDKKLSLSTIFINDEKTSAYEVLKTDDEAGSHPRFHTIVFQKAKGGSWMIRHWHTSN